MTTQSQSHTNTTITKKTMTPAQITFYTGKRVSRDTWLIPEGYGICTITHKMLPEAELMVTFAHHQFTTDQLAQLGAWGEGWCECAEWLSEDGYQQIMARVEACGLKDVYEAGYWGPAPVVETVATVSTETTAAPQAYAVGDTVSFHYALSNIDGNLYTGIIKSPVKHSELWGDVVLIEPLVNAYHLPPRHVSVGRIVAVIATAPVIDAPQPAAQASGACVVPYLTGTDTLRAILDLSNEATQAELDGRMSEARAISKEHTRLYDAYMKALKAEADKWKPAPQSRQEAVSAPSATMQDTTREMVANPPQIEPDANPRLFAPHAPIEADRAILAAKRQAQHDAAQARIKAGQPVQQIAPQRPTAPVSAAPVIVKPRSAMNAAQQASEDGLQALIASSRKNA